jgi:membrane protein required for colicin V production
MNGFNSLDMVFIVLSAILFLRGLVRGLIKEFFSIGAIFFGALGSFLFSKNVAVFIRENYLPGVERIPELLGYIIVFIIIFFICKLLQKLLSDIISGLNLEPVDKVLGGVFGLAEGFIAITLILFVMYIQPVFDFSELLNGSFFDNFIRPVIIENAGLIHV